MCLFIDTGHSSIATDLRVPSATLAAAPKILEHYTLPDPKRDQMLAAGTTCFVHVLCTNTRPKVARLFATDADDLYCSRVGECVAEISMMATMKSGFVSHVESPSSFWFQAACDQMDAVLEELETADAFPCVRDAVLGGLYAAKWKEDDRFYRARLLRQEDEWGGESFKCGRPRAVIVLWVLCGASGRRVVVFKLCVFFFVVYLFIRCFRVITDIVLFSIGFRVAFIDYGNSAVATDLRQLPESLQNLPEMVAHCRLQTDVTTAVDQYSAEPSLTMDQFRNLINADVALHIRLIDINTKPNVVRLFLDAELTKEIRVEDEDLMSSCASMSLHEGNVDSSTDGGAIDEANEEAENGFGAEETVDAVEAFLSWFVSSEDFYLQDKHRSEWGDQLVERLVDANGFAALTDRNVGDLCAARFVDDDAFYRARILSVDQSGEQILYSLLSTINYTSFVFSLSLSRMQRPLHRLWQHECIFGPASSSRRTCRRSGLGHALLSGRVQRCRRHHGRWIRRTVRRDVGAIVLLSHRRRLPIATHRSHLPRRRMSTRGAGQSAIHR